SQRIWRWDLDAFHELHYARYLLQPTAVELCHSHRAGHLLLSFGSARARRDWVAGLVQRRPRLQVFDRARKQAWAAALAQRWARHGMSTFDYLMALNTLAGRSFCDLDQYPVFPWVLRDFESAELDLNDPASYRDLSKPIGALNPDQLEFFRARYESLKRDRDLPPFFYGTHYSSAGIVLFYLLRLAPFTRLARQLQGGKFDHADRLFQSVAGAWHSCTHHSSDVKELVPEFFCQPEFLRNAGKHALGVRQDGAALGDVELPPWANGSPEEFVRLHRRALESEAVSRGLHLWIDLIFGWRQRGRPAEEACNAFFYLTYEGAVDLEALTDPMQRAAVEDQIRHFGQTPIQLF
ncbi:Beige/BEACH domain-containing protein, partial [Helicosporidium sp. ATCC 50920]